jgi:ArsR family transcriptional regulator
MSTRIRPEGCCTNPVDVAPLDAAGRRALAAGFRALGDPTRLAIYHLIAGQCEPICACDIVDRFDLSQPTISHHLKTLRDAGLVTVTRQGVWAFYAADPAGAARLGAWLAPRPRAQLRLVPTG